ncbi:MAG: LysR family transcriptional regulator [Chloroflexi bacterium]|nr:LysR family transcriptional regulator [Chloroflexota bacterium]
MKINVKHLQHFYWVAKLGAYSRAAEQLGLSEPAVHRSVQNLERECGVQLLCREKGRLRATHAGRILQEYGERFNTLQLAAEESVSELVAPRTAVVLFGVSRIFAVDVGRCLARWKSEYPDAHIGVTGGLRGELYVRVLAGELDFALASVAGLPAGLTSSNVAFEDEVIVVGPAGHPLSKRRAVSLAEISTERFVTSMPGTTAHSLLLEIAEETRARLNVVAEVGQAETELELVAGGYGIGIRSRHLVEEAIRQGRLSVIAVAGFPRRVLYGFVFRSAAPPSKEARALISYLESALTDEGWQTVR